MISGSALQVVPDFSGGVGWAMPYFRTARYPYQKEVKLHLMPGLYMFAPLCNNSFYT